MNYRREIDGLRAIAVMPVILFHAGFSVFGGGFVGVDVFFVISGYLITTILIADLEAGQLSILKFYERRARRILPALFTVLAVCIPFAFLLMLPNRFKDFLDSLVATVFFSSNILFWQEYGYFEPSSDLKPLLHTWSLAVEEQFYLLFPPALALLWRFGRRGAFWGLVGVAVLSLLMAEVGWRYFPTANFFLAPPRTWELLAGSICAFVLAGRGPRSSNLLSMIGLALVLGSVFLFDERTPFPSLYALAPVGGAALIVLFAGPGTAVSRLLSNAVFVGIGLISYSAYLWHQPIFAFARLAGLDGGNLLVMGALSALALGLAWMTWRYIEQPFRRRDTPVLATRRQVFLASGAAAAVFLAIGGIGHLSNGFEERLSAQDRAVLGYARYDGAAFFRTGRCMLLGDQDFNDFAPECSQSARSFVIGDSHAAVFASGIAPDRAVGQLTQTSCPPVLDFPVFRQPTCLGINDFRIKAIVESGVKRAVLHADWFEYWYRPQFEAKLGKTLDTLARGGVQVVVIGGVPKFFPNLPEMVVRTRMPLVAGSVVRAGLDDQRKVNAELRRLAERHGALFWDPIDHLCTGDDCLAIVPPQPGDVAPAGAALMTFDHAHMTYSGAVVMADRFFADFPDWP